jgi:hypothetical protein
MSQNQLQSDEQARNPANALAEVLPTPSVEAFAKAQMDAFFNLQALLIGELPRESIKWIARFQSEAKVFRELATRLSGARSVPDAATVCQEWRETQLQMAGEDAEAFLVDAQKYAKAMADFGSPSWLAQGVRRKDDAS